MTDIQAKPSLRWVSVDELPKENKWYLLRSPDGWPNAVGRSYFDGEWHFNETAKDYLRYGYRLEYLLETEPEKGEEVAIEKFIDFLNSNWYSFNPHMGKWFLVSEEKPKFYTSKEVLEEYRKAISGDSSKGGDLEVSDRSPDLDSVVTPLSSSSNSIDEDWEYEPRNRSSHGSDSFVL